MARFKLERNDNSNDHATANYLAHATDNGRSPLYSQANEHDPSAAFLLSKPPAPLGEIIDPITAELIACDDIDSLLDSYERIDRRAEQLNSAKHFIRQALAALVAEVPGKTRRVQGARRKAVVKMPDDSWDQPRLKEAWHAYPNLREQVLRIGKIDVQLREWWKFAKTAGPPNVETFRDMVASAKREATGLPTITIEE